MCELIKTIRVNNFKALKDVRLELSKLNLLIGPNASGKSSILQALAFLKQNIGCSLLRYNGKYVSLGSFSNVVYKHMRDLSIGIEVCFSLSSKDRQLLKEVLSELEANDLLKRSCELKTITYSVTFKQALERGEVYIDGMPLHEIINFNIKGKYKCSYVSQYIPRFYIKKPWYVICSKPCSALKKLLDCISNILQSKIAKIYFFSVLRGVTRREYDIVDYLPIDIAVQDISDMGLRATSALFYMKDRPEFYAKMNKIIELLNRFGIDIRMVTSRAVSYTHLTLPTTERV